MKKETKDKEYMERLERDVEAYRNAGRNYESEITRLENLLAVKTEKLEKSIAQMVEMAKELKAAKRDINRCCETCKRGDGKCYELCENASGWKWRG